MSTLSKSAILEITNLNDEASRLAAGSASDRARASVLLSRISNIKSVGLSSDEVRKLYGEALVESTAAPKVNPVEHRRLFENYLRWGNDKELRDFLAGSETIAWTQGAAGGFTVPILYDDTLRLAFLQTDPVLSDTVVDFEMSAGDLIQPQQISGYDLSTISGSIVAEVTQVAPVAIPVAKGATLRSDITFRANVLASFEGEQDIPGLAEKINKALFVALGRKAGRSVMSGRGGTDVSGVPFQLGTPSINNATAGKITATDINNIFFAVDRYYRNQTKCAWLMSDPAYKFCRNAVDDQHRPLLNMERDSETLMGKPVYVSPSLLNTPFSIGGGAVLFGDMSHIKVHLRKTEFPGGIEKGEALYTGRMRLDATLFDPSSGNAPPIVMALIS